jgi:LacI family transcriptional regulator, galactose operon repressor
MVKVGIRQVAAEAGVSVSTVSNVLNDHPHAQVRAETRERVLLAAQRLGYKPSRAARSLRTRRSETLGLLSDSIVTTPYAGQMILGAQRAAQERGYTVVLFNTGDDAEVEKREVQALLDFGVDGIVYATMYHRAATVPEELRDSALVLLDAESPALDVPCVVPDEVGGGKAAAQELLAHGHRRIGFITNIDDVPATHGRLQGYQEALSEAGVEFDPRLVAAEESETWGGYQAAIAVLGQQPRPTALFCYNDRMAMGAYRAAAELGLRIPTDLSIVGFDDQELITRGLYPELTSVALPHYEMGRWAVHRLVGILDQEDGQDDPEHRLMPCPIVRRGSVTRPHA